MCTLLSQCICRQQCSPFKTRQPPLWRGMHASLSLSAQASGDSSRTDGPLPDSTPSACCMLRTHACTHKHAHNHAPLGRGIFWLKKFLIPSCRLHIQPRRPISYIRLSDCCLTQPLNLFSRLIAIARVSCTYNV